MPRRRLGVVLLVPGPVAVEVDGLRQACGDGALERVASHLTLVPPVNVRDERVRDALDVVRGAAASARPVTVTLGPPATFAPASASGRTEIRDDCLSLTLAACGCHWFRVHRAGQRITP
jgi:2'-5' RNA ligase